MKKLLLGLVAIILVAGCTGTGTGIDTGFGNCISGCGNVITQEFSLDEFDSISYTTAGTLYLTRGEQFVMVEAEDNILELLSISVQNRRLKISSDNCFITTKPIKIYISIETLKALTSSGSGDIVSETKFDANELSISMTGSGNVDMVADAQKINSVLTGSGNLILKGMANEHSIVSSGSGNVKAYDLSTERTDVKSTGSGYCEIDVSAELDVIMSGSGNIYYTGNPVVTQSITGSGRLIKK